MPPKPKLPSPKPTVRKKEELGLVAKQMTYEARAILLNLQNNEPDYVLKNDWDPSHGMKIVPAGSKIYKCTDGYFAIFVEGNMLHYRIGKTVLDGIKESELTL